MPAHPTEIADADLRVARDAVVDLLRRHHRGVNPVLLELSRNNAATLPALVKQLSDAAAELKRLAVRAAAKVKPFWGVLALASGKVHSDHQAAIECAQRFAATAADLTAKKIDDDAIRRWSAWVRSDEEWESLKAGGTPSGNIVQRWLASVGSEVDNYLAGINLNPRSKYERSCGIDFEARRAAILREAGGPTPSAPKKGIPLEAARKRVDDYLKKHGKVDPDRVTIRDVAKTTGVSLGQITNTLEWQVFEAARKRRRKPVSPASVPCRVTCSQ